MNVIGFIITAVFFVGFAFPALILGAVFIYEILKDCKPLLFALLTFPVFPLIILVLIIKDFVSDFKEKRKSNVP